jgi:hypothetical protein
VSKEHDHLINHNFDVAVQCDLPERRRDDSLWHD